MSLLWIGAVTAMVASAAPLRIRIRDDKMPQRELKFMEELRALQEDNIFFDDSMSMPGSSPVPSPVQAPVVGTPTGGDQAPATSPIEQLQPSNDEAPTLQSPTANPPVASDVPNPSQPILSPAPGQAPVQAPTTDPNVPTAEGTPDASTPTALVPSVVILSAQPSPVVFQKDIIFQCTENGIDESLPPQEAATVLEFTVGYEVETEPDVDLESVESEIEKVILGSALSGALECVQGSSLFSPFDGQDTPVPMNTTISDDLCFPTENVLNDCVVLVTSFQVVVAEDMDPEAGRFLGYVRLQQDMDEGAFQDAIPLVERFEYSSPLPLLPPFTDPEQPNDPAPVQARGATLSVTPWTVGAVVAVSVGGVIALWVWGRNRRTRNRRHQTLIDESSFVSPDPSLP